MIEFLVMGAVASWLAWDTVHKAATAAERRERLERERLIKKLAELEELERQAARASNTWSPPRSQRRDHDHRSPKRRREDRQRVRQWLLDLQQGDCPCGAAILHWTGSKIKRDRTDGLQKLWCAKCCGNASIPGRKITGIIKVVA
jgi:ABC-type nickel/cobalt efflux system permease component RcnA